MKLLPSFVVISLLAAPLVSTGQTTVFQDTFASGNLSTLNPTATSPGTLTGSRTAYEIASSKGATSTAIAAGSMTFGNFSTSSGYCEAQALFTNSPITLSSAGQYIEVFYTFTDTTTLFNGNANDNEQVSIGLYNSGGSGPTNGTALWNSGLLSSLTSGDVGCTKGWLGYCGMIAYTKSAALQASAMYTRPAQTAANNLNQGLCPVSGYASGVNLSQLAGVQGQPALTVGNQYTLDLKIVYVNATTLLITNTLYVGAGNGGAAYSSGGFTAVNANTVSGANVLTTTFDGLCIGFRPTSSPTTAETMKINNVTVISYIPTAPAITGLTNETVIAGTSPTLSPTITGTPAPAYQWQLTNGVSGFTNLPWATGATLTLTNVQYAQDGSVYALIASNSVGAVTNSMTLSVIVAPSIAGLIPQSVPVGSTVTISPTVSGQPVPTLQWQTNGVNTADGPDANGSTISGSQTSTLTIVNAQTGDSGTYSLVASNSAGMVTNSMTLTVAAGNTLPVITGLTNITVIQGNNGTFSASVSGLPVPTLQWLDQSGTPIPGATSSALTLTNVQYSQDGYAYSLVASNVVGSVTNSATLTVTVPPVITSQPASLVVTNTQSASFTVAATGEPAPTYQWYMNGSPVSSLLNSTATNATFTLASTVATNNGSSFYVQVSNSAGTTNSATVTLTVNSAMAVAALSPANGATNICYDTPLYLTFSQAPTLQKAGAIKIFNVTNSATPVDTINLSLSVDRTVYASYINNAYNVQSRAIAGDTFTNFPVIITGNQAAIYPHLDLLTSNQTYYVTVDDGTFTDAAGANFAGITATNAWQFSTKVGGPANPTNLVVAADGSGDFVTVQGALDSVPSANTTPTVINIHNGIYTEIVDIHSKNNLLLRGQSRSGAIVGYPNNANLQGSTHYRMAFKVNANDIALDNLTVTNMTPVGGSQAEALMIETSAARFILNNANVGSYQDTVLANAATSQGYFYNSLIEGQFDYVWGGGNLFFTNCELRTLLGYNGSASGGNVTASRTANGATGNWAGYYGLYASNGISFVGCNFTRATNTITSTTVADSNGTTNGNVAWINCSFDANYITPSAAVLNSQLLWEYGNSNLTDTAAVTFNLGVGDSAPELTGSDSRLLAAQNATTWLNGWVPQLSPNILTNPVGQTVNYGSNVTFTVAATGIPAPTYQWLSNGIPMTGLTGPAYAIANANTSDAGSYSVIVSNSAGVVTSSLAVLAVNPPPNTAPVFTAPPVNTNFTINVGVNLAVACTATDATPQTLTYALLVAPSGATLDPGNGTFAWRPTVAQADSTNNVSMVVTTSILPALSTTNGFSITVNPLTPPVTSAPTYAGGLFSITVTGQAGPDYALQATTNLAGGTWVDVAVTNSPASPFLLTDPNAGAQPAQFYRIVTGPPLP